MIPGTRKPHLVFKYPWWYCYWLSTTGMGRNPKEAYLAATAKYDEIAIRYTARDL